MLVVLDAFCLVEALTLDEHGVKKTLVDICDQIVFSEQILNEYTKNESFSSVIPELEKLKQFKPKKAEQRNPGPAKVTGLGKQHKPFIEDAAGLKANYFITNNEKWLEENIRIKLPKDCNLSIVTPTKYVKQRKANKS